MTYEGAHRSIGDLERSLRDVDLEDLQCYLLHDDLERLIEYERGLVESERNTQWPN